MRHALVSPELNWLLFSRLSVAFCKFCIPNASQLSSNVDIPWEQGPCVFFFSWSLRSSSSLSLLLLLLFTMSPFFFTLCQCPVIKVLNKCILIDKNYFSKLCCQSLDFWRCGRKRGDCSLWYFIEGHIRCWSYFLLIPRWWVGREENMQEIRKRTF